MKVSQEYGFMAIGVDMQNDFCPGGSLAVPNGDDVIAPFNAFAAKIRQADGSVVFTRDWHPAQTDHFDSWPPHCIAGTAGAEFHKDLIIKNNDLIISKGTGVDEDAYSGFQGVTPEGKTLEAIIADELANKQRVVLGIGGLATDYCVKATVLDALQLSESIGDQRLLVVALRSCMRAVNIKPDDGRIALEQMRTAGALFKMPEGALL